MAWLLNQRVLVPPICVKVPQAAREIQCYAVGGVDGGSACSSFTPMLISTIWIAPFDMKVQGNMVSQTPKVKPKSVPFEEFAADIERRRAETGITELPRNSGKRRTESKKALLAAIEAAGGKW
jgi:hypothetical protein